MMLGAVHVLPVDDTIEHADHGCLCGPDYWCEMRLHERDQRLLLTSSRWLVTHHSLDGREHRETDHHER